MSLSDELSTDTTPSSGYRCSVCVFYEKLNDTDRATFDQWIADAKPLMRLWRACRSQGLTTGHFQFSRHVKDHHEA